MSNVKRDISVIIPAFNAEKTIGATISSVLAQTFENFELIIINDGSNDSTLNVIETFQDDRIQVFTYENSGASASRNRGLKQAIADYIAFLDADDLWTSDKLEAQFNALQSHPHVGVAYSWTDLIDESGHILHPGLYARESGYVLPKLLLINFLESGSNPLIRRQALAEVGGFDETLPAFQDTDLYIRLAHKYEFIAVPKVQVYYRRSRHSISSNLTNLEKGGIESLTRAFSKAPASVQHLKQHSISNHYKIVLFKAIQGIPEKPNAHLLAQLIIKLLKTDPSILSKRVFVKIVMKYLVIILFSHENYAEILSKNRFKWLTEFRPLLGYMKIEPVLQKGKF